MPEFDNSSIADDIRRRRAKELAQKEGERDADRAQRAKELAQKKGEFNVYKKQLPAQEPWKNEPIRNPKPF